MPIDPDDLQLPPWRVIYAVQHSRLEPRIGGWFGGDLLWYGHRESEFVAGVSWARNAGVSAGRRFPGYSTVFSAGEGIIYAVRRNGDLLWYRHDGRAYGESNWAGNSGNKVGNGWQQFKQVFSGGDGIIYAVQHAGLDPSTGRRTGRHLLWYRHDGWRDGSRTWAANSGATVGRYWEHFSMVFSGVEGVIFAIQANGDLLWYRHDGRGDGSFNWDTSSGKKVGNGWNFAHVFAG